MYTSEFTKELEQAPQEVVDLLLEIGVPQNLMGYHMIVVAVSKIMREPSWGNDLTRCLYPWLGALAQITASAAERRMRSAIETTVAKMPMHAQLKVFGATINADTGTIATGSFLCLLANTVRRQLMSKPETAMSVCPYPKDMQALRERLINDMLAERDSMFGHMLDLYRLNGGKY